MLQSVNVSNVFNILTLNQFFGKRKPFSKNWSTYFLGEATKIETTSFLFKTALSDTNVKTNRMATHKMDLSQRVEFLPVTT